MPPRTGTTLAWRNRDESGDCGLPSPSVEPKFDHPTQKPLLLFETPIRNHLRPGKGVYDPFCGSGTVLIAAERTGSHGYAMEIDPRFVDVALARWEAFSGGTAVLADG